MLQSSLLRLTDVRLGMDLRPQKTVHISEQAERYYQNHWTLRALCLAMMYTQMCRTLLCRFMSQDSWDAFATWVGNDCTAEGTLQFFKKAMSSRSMRLYNVVRNALLHSPPPRPRLRRIPCSDSALQLSLTETTTSSPNEHRQCHMQESSYSASPWDKSKQSPRSP